MALTPWNRQEEWYQEMINSGTGKYLPSITAQDSGKVLTVENDGSWGVENVPSELPAVSGSDKDKYLHTNASTGDMEWSAVNEVPTVGSSDKGKYLHSDASTGNVEWSDAPTELPSVSGTDEGKVLTVNNSGVWVAQTPASVGGRFVVTFSYDEGADTWSADKTLEEISAAWVAEQNIFALFDSSYTPPSSITVEDGAVTWIAFASVDVEAMVVGGGFAIDADGVHYYEYGG